MPQQKEAEDFRSLHAEVRADRRKTAFEMMDEGYTREAIAHRVHVSISTLSEWRVNRKEIESNGYHRRKRGRQDDQKILSEPQQKEIVSALKDTLPDDHGISAFLWSRKAISEFAQKEYDAILVPQRVSVYTRRWGFSPQRPKKQASEQDEKKIEKWLKEEYPKILKRAKEEKAEIHWGDETNLNINSNYQKTYAPRNATPTVKIPARKTSYSLISSLTNQGALRYMAYKGGMNAKLFKQFLQRLIKDTDKKIFLIVDNLRVHHASMIQEWEEKHKNEIEIFFPAPILSSRKP